MPADDEADLQLSEELTSQCDARKYLSNCAPLATAAPAMVELAKDSIDLGIIVEDPETALKFYKDTLGFEYDAIGPMDMGDGTVMHRLLCGTSLIKVREVTPPPPNKSAPGGISASTGNRYCPSQAPPPSLTLCLSSPRSARSSAVCLLCCRAKR